MQFNVPNKVALNKHITVRCKISISLIKTLYFNNIVMHKFKNPYRTLEISNKLNSTC